MPAQRQKCKEPWIKSHVITDLTISTKKTEVVHQPALGKPTCLRTMWQDKIPDTEVQAGMQSMHTVLKLAQLRWTGHVIRMPDERLPRKVFYGELQERKRSQGGQKKRYKDTLKASLKDFDIPIGSWEGTALERSKC